MSITFNNICRICMQEDPDLIKLSTIDEDFLEFSTKLYFCIPSVQIDDTNFPQQLCKTCLADLRTTYNFKNKCLQSTQRIKNILYNISSVSDKINDSLFLETNFIEIKQIQDENMQGNNNLEDILRNNFENDIEERFDVDHSYFTKKNAEIGSKNEEKGERNKLIDKQNEILLKECVLDPIFENVRTNINIKIENDNESENMILENVNLIENELDPINLSPENFSITNKFSNRQKITDYEFFCTICDAGFDEEYLENHTKIHQKYEVISCPSCKRKFDSSDIKVFFRHYCPQHNRPFMVTCTDCYRKFKSPQALANHKKVHKDTEKIYFCRFCDIYFQTNQKLEWHMRNGIHTDKFTKKLKRYN